MRLLQIRWICVLNLMVLFSGFPEGDLSLVQVSKWMGNPFQAFGAHLVAGRNPDQMVNLILGAALIVLVIFAGVALRRPKP